MVVGVVAEIKPFERRVALTPSGALELARHGATVLVEAGAGRGSGFADADYERAGARVCPASEEVWASSDVLLKVKEPVAAEYGFLRRDQVLFTYLHLAPNRPLIEALLSAGTTAIAYETVEADDGSLPLLTPMSEIAGRLAAQAGAYLLQAPMGGSGTLIGGAPGVRPARVLVLGGGVVGANAARVAAGMGADVLILERALPRIRTLEESFAGTATVLMSDTLSLEAELPAADVVIAAVLIPGAIAPHLVTRASLGAMRPGAVLVDVAIDQGGCAETARPTSHDDPTFVIDGVLHYCVTNMPGAVPVTATRALTNATLRFVLRLVELGVDEALARDPGFARGLNVRDGEIVYRPVADAYASATPVAA